MEKPNVFKYEDPVSFMRDQITYLKATESSYSITQICKSMRRCSPSLISNILAGKRRITEDRIQDLSKVLKLSATERDFFKSLIWEDENGGATTPNLDTTSKRRRVSSFILNDWINPFVKDSVRLRSVRENFRAIYSELSAIGTKKRIDKSVEFLVRHGYLKKNEQGKLIESDPLHVLGDENVDKKIRRFHKNTLELAKRGLDQFSVEERLAQAMILPLDEESHTELRELIQEFSKDLQNFSERHKDKDHRLYQLIMHLTPTGGEK